MSRKLIIGIIVLVVIAAAGAVGYYQWNRKPAGVEDKDAKAVTAEILSQAYSTDENAANRQYLNKALAVSGTVGEVTTNADGKPVLLLQSGDPMSGVLCTMRDTQAKAAVGQSVTVKGFCSGYTMDVVLSDCILD